MTAATKPALPDELHRALAKAGKEIKKQGLQRTTLDHAIALLDRMSPADAVRADRQIAYAAGLFIEPVFVNRLTTFADLFGKRTRELPNLPGSEHLLVFHFSGYVREEALGRFHGGVRSPFFFAALAYRLNDWVPQVRLAARKCADRTFPLTDPAIVTEAAIPLLLRRRKWRRWGDEAEVVDQAISRSDVLDCLIQRIRDADTAPMAAVLRDLLRRPGVDDRLPELAADATQPVVRGAALQTLIDGKATWRTGYRRQWIDKPNFIYRRLPVYEERPLAIGLSRVHFLEMAARDRSAAVRRIAAAALIKYRDTLTNLPELMELLAGDASPSVRERIDFLTKHPT